MFLLFKVSAGFAAVIGIVAKAWSSWRGLKDDKAYDEPILCKVDEVELADGTGAMRLGAIDFPDEEITTEIHYLNLGDPSELHVVPRGRA
jgi:hypothetical protein